MSMQSVGQTARHNRQPLQAAAMTVCINLPAPMMQSTGQAAMQSLQPMHASSRMNANCNGGRGAGVSGDSVVAGDFGDVGDDGESTAARPSKRDNASTVAAPPGGQRSMSASPDATASAYARHDGSPHSAHCVCGKKRSMRAAKPVKSAAA